MKTEISFYKKGKYALFVAKFVIISSQRSIQGVFYEGRRFYCMLCQMTNFRRDGKCVVR